MIRFLCTPLRPHLLLLILIGFLPLRASIKKKKAENSVADVHQLSSETFSTSSSFSIVQWHIHALLVPQTGQYQRHFCILCTVNTTIFEIHKSGSDRFYRSTAIVKLHMFSLKNYLYITFIRTGWNESITLPSVSLQHRDRINRRK